MKLRTLSLAAATLLSASCLFAQLREGTVEIEPFGGYLFGGQFSRGSTALFTSRVDVDDAATYGGRVGYNFTSLLELEFQYSYVSTDLVAPNGGGVFGPGPVTLGSLRMDYYLGYATFNFGRGRVVPYFTIGAGAAYLNPKVAGVNTSTDTRFTASAGGGVKIFINPHFGLRFDGRAYSTSLGSTRYYNCDPYGCTNSNWLTNGSVDGGIIIAF
jgi:Outer membrane protein beta-barrel domain